MNIPTPYDVERAKRIRKAIAQAIREGTANPEDYGLDENGLIAVGAIQEDGLRKIRSF